MDAPRHADIAGDILGMLSATGGNGVKPSHVTQMLDDAGIAADDPRVARTRRALSALAPETLLQAEDVAKAIHPSEATLIDRVSRGDLVVPDFAVFTTALSEMFDQIEAERGGAVADYIPQLARVPEDKLALAVCTVDGQVFSLGDDTDAYCVQSTCKPINYAAALTLNGETKVHKHVGREPSGQSFNELTLNSARLPHNPMINSGAIMCSSLIRPEDSLADRFDYIADVWRQLAGGRTIGFDNAVYHSEKETAHRNFALAHFMMENRAFPEGADINATLDFYFQCCSITVDARGHAAVGATLANGGVCPLSNRRIFDADVVKNCLSLMLSCGMYDFSGEYAFTVGLPAKSGVSGALMIVVPGLCGVTVWSPRLDAQGNSVRGVAFSRKLVERFPFHIYANVVEAEHLEDPRRRATSEADVNFALLWAASRGDVGEIRRLFAQGVDVNLADYDGRTALHLAASEGQARAVTYLLSHGAAPAPVDRWGNTPLQDAERGGHATVAEQIRNALEHGSAPPPDPAAGWTSDTMV